MALSEGAHLGPYEILAPFGAGRIEEVYRARDTSSTALDHFEVAPSVIKTMPAGTAQECQVLPICLSGTALCRGL